MNQETANLLSVIKKIRLQKPGIKPSTGLKATGGYTALFIYAIAVILPEVPEETRLELVKSAMAFVRWIAHQSPLEIVQAIINTVALLIVGNSVLDKEAGSNRDQ